ncbi:MAG TPA: hypothetical protein VN821_10180 [Candidatus Udaeobacter sp.]|nr:hypothetical protein [Candidatus Udaeobacter sp.]
MSALPDREAGRPGRNRRFFRRAPWENTATGIIAAGIVMLMQPFALVLYTYSFLTILAGTAMFVIVSKFPE